MKHTIVCGFVAPTCSGDARKLWNQAFSHGKNSAFFDCYRTKTIADLELRLSEMFHLERRGYVIADDFSVTIIPLLDIIDASAKNAGRVDTVVNRGGVLSGAYVAATRENLCIEERMNLWGFMT